MLTCSALAVGDLGRILRVHDALLEHLLREPRACSPFGSRSRGRSTDTLSLLCGILCIDNALLQAESDARVAARCNLCGILSIDDAVIDGSPAWSRSGDALRLLRGVLSVDDALDEFRPCGSLHWGRSADARCLLKGILGVNQALADASQAGSWRQPHVGDEGRSTNTLSLLCGRLCIDNALREAEFDARVSACCNLCGVLSIDDALIDATPSGSRSTNRSANALSLLYSILGVNEAFCGPERCVVQSLRNLAETKRRAASGAARVRVALRGCRAASGAAW